MPMFFAFDTETSGLDPENAEILSIAMLLLDAELNELQRKVVYALPDKYDVNPRAAAVNGYTREKWVSYGAVTQPVLFAEVRDFVRPYRHLIPVGHNVKFDNGFLQALFHQHNGTKAYRQCFSYHSVDTIGTAIMFDMVKFGKVDSSLKLISLCERFGINLGENAHDALADIVATVELLRFQCAGLGTQGEKKANIAPPSSHSSLLTQSKPWQFTAGKYKGKSPENVAEGNAGYLEWVLKNVTDLSTTQEAAVRTALNPPADIVSQR